MNFAPYQDSNPETERALSPPPSEGGRRSKSPRIHSPTPSRPFSPPLTASNNGFIGSSGQSPPPQLQQQQYRSYQDGGDGGGGAISPGDLEGARFNIDAFQTSLPIRMDYEAMLAYLLLPPAGGVLLLLFEHKSDYVR